MGEDLAHTVYRGPEGETTEWGDIQRRIGNFAPLPEVFKPAPWRPAEEDEGAASAAARRGAEAGREHVNQRSARELEEMEDEFADDGFLEEYRCVLHVRRCPLPSPLPLNPPLYLSLPPLSSRHETPRHARRERFWF